MIKFYFTAVSHSAPLFTKFHFHVNMVYFVFFFSDCIGKAGKHGNEAAGSAKESRAFKRKSSTVTRKIVSARKGIRLYDLTWLCFPACPL